MISKKKHERFLYILLSLYTLLVMVFMLLLNGFFIKPKAYSPGDNMSNVPISISWTGSETGSATANISYTPTGSNRGVFVKIDELSDIISNNNDSQLSFSGSHGYVFLRMKYDNNESFDSILESNYNSSNGFLTHINLTVSTSNDFQNYMVSNGFDINNLPSVQYIYGANMGWGISNVKIDGDIEYIDNISDLKRFFINKDDSVVNIGDPDNPQLPEDDSLPVPQKLATDIQNDNVGTPPFISGSWENPGSIYASYDASEVQVEIQYKPVFQLYKKMFNLKLAKVSSSEWLPVTKTQISNYTLNRFILYNAKTGYPNPFDSQTLHSGSLTDDVEIVGNSSGYTDMFNPISARIANGTNWRIRYVIGNKTSLWVVFHVNSIGSLKNEESVSFENASGDPVSADDVNYTNSPQTSTVDKLNVNNFFDSLNAAINGIFNTTNNSFTAQDTEGSKGFYAMFKATFEKFPVFWTFFCLGLVVAILLRILGR